MYEHLSIRDALLVKSKLAHALKALMTKPGNPSRPEKVIFPLDLSSQQTGKFQGMPVFLSLSTLVVKRRANHYFP